MGNRKKHNSTLLRIGGIEDHVHMAVALAPGIAVADFVKEIKSASNQWINDHSVHFPHFEGWAREYFAATFSAADTNNIVAYIKSQAEHHATISLAEEIRIALKAAGIDEKKAEYFLKN